MPRPEASRPGAGGVRRVIAEGRGFLSSWKSVLARWSRRSGPGGALLERCRPIEGAQRGIGSGARQAFFGSARWPSPARGRV